MELKKNKKYELEPKRPMFFGIGMIVSLSLALVAFEWKSPITMIDITEEEPIIDTFYSPPVTEIELPPPPPKAVKITPVEIEIPEPEETPIIDTDTSEEEPIVEVPIEVTEEKAEELPINFAEVMPTFDGGMEKFYSFLGKNIKYPRAAKQMGLEGRVVVQFVVEKDGSLSNIRILKGIGGGCDEEAIRVMEKVPNFIPGKQGDVRVRVQMVVPISFNLK